LNPRMEPAERGLGWVRKIRSKFPLTPLFLIQDPDEGGGAGGMPWSPEHDAADLKRAGVHGVLNKPLRASDLITHAAPLSEDGSVLPSAPPPEDADFIPVVASVLLTRAQSLYDVHLKLASGHFVKVLSSGESLLPEQLSRYREKGVRWFHVRKSDIERSLRACDALAGHMLSQPGAAPAEVAEATLLHGEDVINAMRLCGVGEVQIMQAKAYVSNVERLMQRMLLNHHPALKDVLAQAAMAEHGAGTALVSSLLCEAMEVDSAAAVEVVGLASVLHDVALPLECMAEDESKMPETLRAKYREHPLAGAQLLEGVQGIESSVIHVVRSHHERRNLKGFPVHFGVARVNPLAELVGLADELQHLLLGAAKGENGRRLADLLTHDLLEGFSKGVADAVKAYFLHTLR
ncbi:MAG TPA: HD domain-containing protein, partial [Bdellovibrionota bacterium]|nr:HD domain-containing protein [Bdellovibrionota bacterium]